MSVLSVLVSSLTLWPCPTVHCLSCLSLTVFFLSLSFSQYLPRLPSPPATLYCSWGPGALGPGLRARKMESGAGYLALCISPISVPFLCVSLLSPPGQGPSSLPKSSSPLPGPLQALRPGDGGKGCPQERWRAHGGRPDALHPQGLPVELLRGAAAAGADLDVCRARRHRPPLRPLPDPLCGLRLTGGLRHRHGPLHSAQRGGRPGPLEVDLYPAWSQGCWEWPPLWGDSSFSRIPHQLWEV